MDEKILDMIEKVGKMYSSIESLISDVSEIKKDNKFLRNEVEGLKISTTKIATKYAIIISAGAYIGVNLFNAVIKYYSK
jgi:hypothetical protein